MAQTTFRTREGGRYTVEYDDEWEDAALFAVIPDEYVTFEGQRINRVVQVKGGAAYPVTKATMAFNQDTSLPRVYQAEEQGFAL